MCKTCRNLPPISNLEGQDTMTASAQLIWLSYQVNPGNPRPHRLGIYKPIWGLSTSNVQTAWGVTYSGLERLGKSGFDLETQSNAGVTLPASPMHPPPPPHPRSRLIRLEGSGDGTTVEESDTFPSGTTRLRTKLEPVKAGPGLPLNGQLWEW